MFKSFVQALTTNLSVCCIWYAVEYQEYGQLYFRECDNIVWIIYLCILWYLFYTKERDNNRLINNIIKLCQPNKNKDEDNKDYQEKDKNNE